MGLVQTWQVDNDVVSSPQLDSSRKLSEIKSLHEKIHVSTEEAKKKEETYKQLVKSTISSF